jgi:hypothetical protein
VPYFAVPQNVTGKTDRESQQRGIAKQLDSDDWGVSNFGFHMAGLQELQVKLVAVFMLSVALGARSWDII